MLKPDIKAQFYRLRKLNKQTKIDTRNKRNLSIALGLLTQIGEEVNVPRCVNETASHVYRKALKKGATRGRTIKNIVAASLYIGCRVCDVSRSITVIAEAANIPKKKFAYNYRYLHNLLDQSIPPINTGKIISKLVKNLNHSGCVEEVALKIYRLASELKVTNGKSPSGMAAASVYMACRVLGEKETQDNISSKTGITAVTIRNRYKELVKRLNLEIFL
jgi:transcription initiation factor TFIIB